MPDFQHILVPVDFSEKNAPALTLAGRLAASGQGRITLLHVIETIEYVLDDEIQSFYEKLQVRSQEQLERLIRTHYRDQAVEVNHHTVMGSRGRDIVSFVLEHEIDLVVMSSHRVELSEAPRGWGTLSHQLSIACPCSVLLVKV
jgi:nucleotide-binding universal stress UspA family protein